MTWARSWHMADRKDTSSKHYIQFHQLQFANLIMWCAAIITLFNLIFATYANGKFYQYQQHLNPKTHQKTLSNHFTNSFTLICMIKY